MEIFPISAEATYKKLESGREPFLERARDASKLTIPSIMPEEGHNAYSDLVDMYQSVGASGSLNLASKMVLALLPPNQPFFQLAISEVRKQEFIREAMLSGVDPNQVDLVGELNKAVIQMERIIQDEIESSQVRHPAYNIFLNLIISGNILMYVPPEMGGRPVLFRLDQYVVQRDHDGTVREIVVKEKFPKDRLPDAIRNKIDTTDVDYTHMDMDANGLDDKDNFCLYTHIKLHDGFYHTYQEVAGQKVEGSEGKFKPEDMPWRPLRWMSMIGEHYGRGKIDDMLGDLNSYEKLNKAITEAAHIGAKSVFLVRPGAMARPRDLAKVRNGGFVKGNPDDITPLDHGNKVSDLRTAQEQAQNLEIRLNKAFLNTSSIQRNAERVTAEEIRLVSQELAEALGGVYTLQSTEFQEPLLLLIIARLKKAGKLHSMVNGKDIKPKVTHGIEALGRNKQLNAMSQFIQMVGASMPEALQGINPQKYAEKVAELSNFNLDEIAFTEQELAEMQQQAQMQQLMQEAGPGIAQEVTKGAVQAQLEQPNPSQ